MAEEQGIEFQSLSKEELASYFVDLLKSVKFSEDIPPKVTITCDEKEIVRGLKHLMEVEGENFSLYTDSATYNSLSSLAYHLGLYREALHFADKSIARDNTSILARLLKAHASLALNNPKKAIGILDEVLKRDPNNIVAHTLMARALMKREQYARALESLKRAYALMPSLDLLMESIVCLIHLKDEEHARRIIHEARRRFSAENELMTFSTNLSRAAYGLRKIDLLKLLVRIFPENRDVWVNMARMYRENGEHERAWRCYLRSLRGDNQGEAMKEVIQYRDHLRERFRCQVCKGTGKCKLCRGNGKCPECRNGLCSECKGTGLCKLCKGSGKCPECRGRGTKGVLKRCDACSGKGLCECYDGRCRICSGTGKCPSCKGTQKCHTCDGKGVCHACEGRGISLKIDLSAVMN